MYSCNLLKALSSALRDGRLKRRDSKRHLSRSIYVSKISPPSVASLPALQVKKIFLLSSLPGLWSKKSSFPSGSLCLIILLIPASSSSAMSQCHTRIQFPTVHSIINVIDEGRLRLLLLLVKNACKCQAARGLQGWAKEWSLGLQFFLPVCCVTDCVLAVSQLN